MRKERLTLYITYHLKKNSPEHMVVKPVILLSFPSVLETSIHAVTVTKLQAPNQRSYKPVISKVYSIARIIIVQYTLVSHLPTYYYFPCAA